MRHHAMRASASGFRAVATSVLAVGVVLHITSLVVGREIFTERVLIPPIEWALSVGMAYAIVAGITSYRKFRPSQSWRRVAYWVLIAYFTASVVLHLRAAVAGTVDYVDAFPTWYSYPIIAVMAGFIAVLQSLPTSTEATADVARASEKRSSASLGANRQDRDSLPVRPADGGRETARAVVRPSDPGRLDVAEYALGGASEGMAMSHHALRASGAVGIVAGVLTIFANALHPPRTFEGFERAVLNPAWEPVHALGIVAFITTIFALIGLFVHQIERAGLLGVTSFVLTVTGIVLAVGVLAADAFIFPVLGSHEPSVVLLDVPGAIIPNSSFGVLMAVSGVAYNIGYILFGVAGWRASVLPRPGFALLAIGAVPLSIGALAMPGIDVAGAVLLGAGHVVLGWELWSHTGVTT